jgi:hypothetical protein
VDQIEFVLGGLGSGVPQDVALPNVEGLSMMRGVVVWNEKCWSAVSCLRNAQQESHYKQHIGEL